ncbi:MAG TPA: hypothetical protein VHN80_25225 [Kineosporiaceae bacterium]|jgi:hypothetical protein|nr:hypothetical protein [Kineosporiaceae bacterium]
MTGPPVVIRYGCAYPDAVIERLASDVADSGLSAQIEPLGPRAGAIDTAGLIAVELSTGATGALLSEAMKTTMDALVDAAQRRRRRQQATGEVRDVAVILHLPGDVQIVVTADASADQTDLLMTAVTQRRTAQTLTAGVWQWNPTALRLDRAILDDPVPEA